jgi:hypothetical protein
MIDYMNENPEMNPVENIDDARENNAESNEAQSENINTDESVDLSSTQIADKIIPVPEAQNDDIIVSEIAENSVVAEEPVSGITETAMETEEPIIEVVEPVKDIEETVIDIAETKIEAEGPVKLAEEVIKDVEEPSKKIRKPVKSVGEPIVENIEPETEAIPVEKKTSKPRKKTEETSIENIEPTPSVLPEDKKPAKTTKKKETLVKSETESSELLSEHDIIALEEEHEIEPAKNKQYSTFSKIELIEKLEELVNTNEIGKIKADVSGIKVAYLAKTKEEKQAHLENYLANGGTKEEYIAEPDSLEERFNKAFDTYKELKIRDDQEQEKIKLQNLELKKQILNEIKQLIDSEDSLKKTYDDFKILQEKWKQIGMVPRNEMEGLWNNYHFQVEKFFEKVKINKELKDLDLKKNLEAKITLCEKAEELLFEKSITKSFKLLQKYHDEWKEIGPVIQDKSEEIWERFKNVSDNINQQRREYYESLNKEQENNLLAKTALCEKVEEINSAEITNAIDWKEKTDRIIEMQKLWDSIGRAPVKFHDEIWERFKSGVNNFFKNKKEFFGEVKDQQFNNYNLKLTICTQAEGLLETNNWKQATNEILKLQQDWKKIGPVPLRYSDKVWKRFRKACDNFFAKKNDFYSNIHGFEKDNQKKKEDLLEKVNSYEIDPDKNVNLTNLKNFQREWVEIGFVPMDVKEKLQNEFKKVIGDLMNKLKISSSEINTINYKNRIESIQSSPDAKNTLQKERIFIEGKLSKLKSEILQLENNLGFFASSKKADLLKLEFEKKIQEAKQEAALLEAKLKLLRSNQ